MRMRRIFIVLTAPIAAVLVVAACTGDDPALTSSTTAEGGGDATDTETNAPPGDSAIDAADARDADALFEPKVSAGFGLSCAIVLDGRVFCWGANSSGQAGVDPAQGAQSTPHEVVGVANAVEIAAGGDHACAVRSDGRVFCWGANNIFQLGAPVSAGAQSASAIAVQGIPDPVTRIAAGPKSTCAVTKAGTAYCWGDNSGGQLGVAPATASSSLPRAVGVGSSQGVAMTGGHACTSTIGDPSQLMCWGDNFGTQLGRPMSTTPLLPAIAFGPGDFSPPATFGVGSLHSCIHVKQALAVSNRGVRCWGENSSGVFGTAIAANARSQTPVKIPGLETDVVSVVVGFTATCGLTSGGALKCVGSSVPLGIAGPDVAVTTPIEVLSSGVLRASVGTTHGCAVLAGASVGKPPTFYCWGRGDEGQLGRGNAFDAGGGASVHAPAAVSGLP
jgi:alpha-tubulin suppressor-like RCC1 family protein